MRFLRSLAAASIAAILPGASPAAFAEGGGGDAPDWAKRIETLTEELGREEREFYEALKRSAPTEPGVAPAPPDMTKHPGVKRIQEFIEIARGAKGTEPGLRAAHWLLTRGSTLPGGDGLEKEAFRLLVEDGRDCPALVHALPTLRHQHFRFGAEEVESALIAIAEKSADAEVRATAEVQRAAWRLEDPKASAERKAEGRRIAEQVLEKHGKTRASRRARGLLNEQDFLQVGKQAPDFEAVDVDGESVRLSKHRGSVVIVDFWTGWGRANCPQAPLWAKAVERLKGRPLVFLAVCCEEGGAAEARKAAKDCGVPGRILVGGGRDGDLCAAWNIRMWPTLFVIDGDGIVRWSGPAGDWDRVAEEWIRVAEAKAGGKK